MKIQLDTVNKTIKVQENINLREFITKIQVLLGKEYEEYTLHTDTIPEYWYNPIYIPFPTEPIYPSPYYSTFITCENGVQVSNDTYSTGTFNIEM